MINNFSFISTSNASTSNDIQSAKDWMRRKDWHVWQDESGETMWMKSVGHWKYWEEWLRRPNADRGLVLLDNCGNHVLDKILQNGGLNWYSGEWANRSLQTWFNQDMSLRLMDRLPLLENISMCQSALLKDQLSPLLKYGSSAVKNEQWLSRFYSSEVISWMGIYPWEVLDKRVAWKVTFLNIVSGDTPSRYCLSTIFNQAILENEDRAWLFQRRASLDNISLPEHERSILSRFILNNTLMDAASSEPRKRL